MSFLEELQEAEETVRERNMLRFSHLIRYLSIYKNKLFLISPKLKHANKEKQAQEAAFVQCFAKHSPYFNSEMIEFCLLRNYNTGNCSSAQNYIISYYNC